MVWTRVGYTGGEKENPTYYRYIYILEERRRIQPTTGILIYRRREGESNLLQVYLYTGEEKDNPTYYRYIYIQEERRKILPATGIFIYRRREG